MNRKELIKNINEIATGINDNEKYIRLSDKQLNQVIDLCQQSQWIDVDDRLPDNMQNKIVVFYENDCSEGVICCDMYFESKGFCLSVERDFAQIIGVKAWQPLPEHHKQAI